MSDNRKFVIFDLDGTLIDSYECVLRCVNKSLDSFSLPCLQLEKIKNIANIEILFKLARNIIKGHVSFEAFKKHFDEIHSEDYIIGVNVINFNAQVLRQYWNNGTMIVILTNKKQIIAKRCMAHFFPTIDCKVIGRTWVESIKEDYDLVKAELNKLGCNQSNTLAYYGDSDVDCRLSKKMNVPYFCIKK